MISPSELMPLVDNPTNPPYAGSNIEGHNIKQREVYCANCVYRIVTDLPMPICGYCNTPLYTVVKSPISDELAHELGRTDSQST